jgi:hypothetical protein
LTYPLALLAHPSFPALLKAHVGEERLELGRRHGVPQVPYDELEYLFGVLQAVLPFRRLGRLQRTFAEVYA